MEVIAGIGSLAFGLFATTLAVKFAAGWLGAGRSDWGRSLVAVLAVTVAMAAVLLAGAAAATFVPGVVGFAVGVLALVGCIAVPVALFARLLDTSAGRAFGIALLAVVIGVVAGFGVAFVLATLVGVSLLGMLAAMGLGAAEEPHDPAAGAAALVALEQSVTQLCACPDEACIEREFDALGNHLMLATEHVERTRNVSAERRINELLNDVERCQDPGTGGAVVDGEPAGVDAGDALAAFEGSVEALCACPDEDCIAAGFDALGAHLAAATDAAEAAGDAAALARIDALLGQMEQCQAPAMAEAPTDLPPGDAADAPVEEAADSMPPAEVAPVDVADAPAEHDAPAVPSTMLPAEVAPVDIVDAPAEDEATAAPSVAAPAETTPAPDVVTPFAAGVERLCACRDGACVERAFGQLGADLDRALAHVDATGDAAVEQRIGALLDRMDGCQSAALAAAPQAPPPVARAPREAPRAAAPPPAERRASAPSAGGYALRPVDPASGGEHLGKLVRLTLGDGTRRTDQLVGWDGEVATLQRSRADGGTRYDVRIERITKLEVFGR